MWALYAFRMINESDFYNALEFMENNSWLDKNLSRHDLMQH